MFITYRRFWIENVTNFEGSSVIYSVIMEFSSFGISDFTLTCPSIKVGHRHYLENLYFFPTYTISQLVFTSWSPSSILLCHLLTKSLSHFTRSPFLPCLSRRVQSGRRTSFGGQVWFIESLTVLVIFFFTYWFIYSFILDIKGVLLSSQTTISFSGKRAQSFHLHSLTHIAVLRECQRSPTSVICC